MVPYSIGLVFREKLFGSEIIMILLFLTFFCVLFTLLIVKFYCLAAVGRDKIN